MKNIFIKIAGIINLITALIHLIAGQIDLVNPLLDSNMTLQQQGELTAVWHIITILLFFTAYLILKAAFYEPKSPEIHTLKTISILYILIGVPFIIVSFWFSIFAPQWILLIPIGLFLGLGIRKL